MGNKPISSTTLNETLTLSECKDGFWLYDATRGMNLAMRAKTRDAAFVGALTYYQRRLKDVETSLRSLQTKVDAFVGQFTEDGDSD